LNVERSLLIASLQGAKTRNREGPRPRVSGEDSPTFGLGLIQAVYIVFCVGVKYL